MKIFYSLWKDIRSGQNLDIYFTALISIFIALLGIFNFIQQSIISSAVLATLAIVSLSLLQNRKENESVREAILHIQNKGGQKEPLLQHPLTSYTTLNQHLLKAKKADFWGLTFERVLPHIRDTLAKRLQSGLEVRFLLLKPDSNAIKMAVFRDRHHDMEELELTLRTSLSILNSLTKLAVKPAKLEIRVVDYLPPWTLVAFDPYLPNGEIFVSLLPFRNTDEVRPSFNVGSSNNGEWITVFQEQFESLWQDAESINTK
ncbi:MAG: hypothetical protein IT314_11335 [Anaerolineales bacterium]|nr:hypothetical protein [Anaerolineales bacterium]